jgi:hypothetical protein
MFARIGTWQGPPEGLENWVARASEVVKPNVQRQPGLAAAYWLVDREGGRPQPRTTSLPQPRMFSCR